ncbi:SRPBCC family protein [Sunxiuqinia elliptica]|uniref:Uncharacterized protein YndB with AHSA1/START domain n=1 Tax=Sunxiuqinia elliptica TaxID=655355 RepID=A0A4R6GTU2_9BACT|nr:SRPBCC domain-containing protein [Sunxiuqinia elliptica]TDN98250.1 uncharacterized protein YndB with AHSA1/START domain [Sunxiuqinia elliptica]TDO60356.1 uncharacterized protein YndB with AHSA1/START domain [Sunxiuqinia elliptica]
MQMVDIEQINYLKAPASTVYHALTTEEGLGNVWTKKLKVKAEIGFINEFDFDEGYLTKLKTVELQENQKVVWECVESDKEWIGTKIFIALSERDGITTIILKHVGWRELTEFYRWCNYNWALFLFRLKNYCENRTEIPS